MMERSKRTSDTHPFYYKRWFFVVLWLLFLGGWVYCSIRSSRKLLSAERVIAEEIIPISKESVVVEKLPELPAEHEEQVEIVFPDARQESPSIKNEPATLEKKEVISEAPNLLPARLEGRIEEGDSLSGLLRRLGVKTNLPKLLKASKAGILNRLQVGRKFVLEQKELQLVGLAYEVDGLTTLTWKLDEQGEWQVKEDTLIPIEELKTVTGRIERSIYISGKNLGLSPRLIKQFVDAFSNQVDFTKVIASDQFTVVFKRFTIDGRMVKPDELMAAELVHKGHTYRIIGFETDHGRVSFYTPEGEGVKGSFLRHPLAKFQRVSSPFNLRRKHPVLGGVRPHYGVDLVASYGTPVLATGGGIVKFAGVKGGYGKVVILSHGSKYTTLYAHLSNIAPNLKVGNRVKREEVIGFVGSTGFSTSAHLHYEFHVNGIPQDPMRVRLPEGERLKGNEYNRFLAVKKHYEKLFDAQYQLPSEHFLVLTNDRSQG